jgi:hypothetical protein
MNKVKEFLAKNSLIIIGLLVAVLAYLGFKRGGFLKRRRY